MNKYKVGSNQYKAKYKTPLVGKLDKILLLGAFTYFTLLGLKATSVYATNMAIDDWLGSITYLSAPVVTFHAELAPTLGLVPEKEKTVDEMVDKYSKAYGKNRYDQNRLKALAHYLLLVENNYAANDNCGDSGRACGPMQFWEDTYNRNRKDMIRKGLATEMGSRYNLENAIDTAIYMFSIGQEKQWGPVFRGEIKI